MIFLLFEFDLNQNEPFISPHPVAITQQYSVKVKECDALSADMSLEM